jgi:hypothetical protein
VLLAGVLMTDETIETFQWIFKEFAKLMGGQGTEDNTNRYTSSIPLTASFVHSFL